MRFDHYEEYFQKFNAPTPELYMDHLSDEDYDAMLVQAIKTGVPIDPEALVAHLPPGTVI